MAPARPVEVAPADEGPDEMTDESDNMQAEVDDG